MIIPRAARPSGAAYAKLERRAGDFATVGVAAQLSLGADGRIAAAGIGLTAVAEAPFAATGAEAALVGQEPNEATFQAAGIAAAAESRPGHRRARSGRVQASDGQGNGRPGAANRGRPRPGAAVGANR